MKNILISGASGFIGQRLVEAVNANIKVLSRRKQPGYETVVCDFEKEDIPKSALELIDTVFHIAGFAHDMRNTDEIRDLYRKVNVNATVRLAELAVSSGVKKFIFVSSVKAGGGSSFGECSSEKDQGNPEGIYGKTKREAELKLLKIGKKSSMHVSIIRSSLVYGPNVKGNLQLMLSGINKRWFPPLPETGNKKSMIHVDDLVRAILFVADNDDTNGEIYIATDGIPHSSRDIYNSMCSALDKSIPKWSIPKRLFDMVSLVNPAIKYKLNKLLGNECYSSAKLKALGFKTKKT